MITIDKSEECIGCSACKSICPVSCISMTADKEGFLYPKTDLTKCTNCHICEAVCPIKNEPKKQCTYNTAYILRSTSCDALKSSSSGAFFYELIKFIIENNGYVFGAIINSELEVEHFGSNILEECSMMLRSKYVQSNMNNVYSIIKKYLDDNNLVCFSGTPCQCAGLKKYLNYEYDNLIIVDMICHGVPSSYLWREYLEYETRKHHSRIKKANFRSKKYGYHNASMQELYFENGKISYETARVGKMMKTYYSNIALRPSCYDCKFKGIDRVSDFTMFDSWNAVDILNIKEDDLGYTNVLIRNEKAKDIIKRINCVRYEVPSEKIIIKNEMIVKSVKRPIEREEYYKVLHDIGFEKTFNKYLKVNSMDIIVEIIKKFAYRAGVMPIMYKINRSIKR